MSQKYLLLCENDASVKSSSVCHDGSGAFLQRRSFQKGLATCCHRDIRQLFGVAAPLGCGRGYAFQYDERRAIRLGQAHVIVKCLGLLFQAHGDVVGSGKMVLYIAREHGNHFFPLFKQQFSVRT